MRALVRTLIPLFASFALLVVGHGLLATLLGIRMSLAHFSMQSIGVVSACYSVGFVLGTRLDGRAIRNVLHIRTFAALCAIAAACVSAFVLFVDPVFWALLRLIYGACIAGLYMVVESWLNANSGRGERGKILGLYSAITYLGFGGGQFLLLVDTPGSGHLFLLVSSLVTMSLVPIALARIEPPEVADIRPMRLQDVYRLQPSGFAGALAAGVVIGSFLGMSPVFAKASGFSTLQISLFMGLTICGGFVLQWPIGMISDRYSRRYVISLVSLCIAVLSAVIALLDARSVITMITLATVWGAFSFTLYPVSVALINDRIEATKFVPASAALLFLYSLGMIAGNLGAGQAMAMWGRSGLFWIGASASTALALFTVLAPSERPADAAVAHPGYQALPRNSPYASFLDPRGESHVQLELDLHAVVPASAVSARGRSNERYDSGAEYIREHQ